MRFKVGDLAKKGTHQDAYAVEIKEYHYYGEFDNTLTRVIGPIPRGREDLLVEVVETLSKMNKEDTDRYESIEGFRKWFNLYGHEERDEYEDIVKNAAIEWGHSNDRNAIMDGYDICYYDSERRKFNVSQIVD